ncbi:hypothetical protein ACHAWF_003493, partial [Thalassiosira exigua]
MARNERASRPAGRGGAGAGGSSSASASTSTSTSAPTPRPDRRPLASSSSPRPGAVLVLIATLALLLLRPSSDVAPPPPPPSPRPRRRGLMRYRGYQWNFLDPRTVDPKEEGGAPPIATPAAEDPDRSAAASIPNEALRICGREVPMSLEEDRRVATERAAACPLTSWAAGNVTVLLLEGQETFGRTGNALIELFHAFQYARDRDAAVAIDQGSWALRLITDMWMAVPSDDVRGWIDVVERSLCVKIVDRDDAAELSGYAKVLRADTRELFLYRREGWHDLGEYVEFQSGLLRALWRRYNRGAGFDVRRRPAGDMCSALTAAFDADALPSTRYSVVHSRSMEGAGAKILGKIARETGCDPVAALDMEPEYVKAILGPLGMLEHPILFITDHQRPEILEKLTADPEIGPVIRLIPEEASWVGGDITAAVAADVFIGNPASSFSGFIAKSRVALGYHNNYLFRKKKRNGEWVDVCDH